MEQPFICGVRLTPDTFHSSFFCVTSHFLFSLVSFVAIFPHTFTVLSLIPLSVSLPTHICSLLLYLISHCCLFTMGTIANKQNANGCLHIQGCRQIHQFTGSGNMRVGPGGLRWLKFFLKGWTRWDSSWTLNFMYFWGNTTEDLWRLFWLILLHSAGLCSCPPPKMHCGTSCFVYYLLLFWCLGLMAVMAYFPSCSIFVAVPKAIKHIFVMAQKTSPSACFFLTSH